MSLKRLVSKLTTENLWIYILTELSKQPMYAYEVAKTLKNKYGISTVTVTVYVVIYKMKREGLIEKRGDTSSFRKPGRKYYAITDKGFLMLEEGKKVIRERLKMLDGAFTNS